MPIVKPARFRIRRQHHAPKPASASNESPMRRRFDAKVLKAKAR